MVITRTALLATAFVLASSVHLAGAVYTCDPASTGLGGATDIQSVINLLLADGDTIVLLSGKYSLTLPLVSARQDITLRGSSGNPLDVILDGIFTPTGNLMLSITTTGTWTISGITFQNDRGGWANAGVVNITNGHLSMSDCIIKGSYSGWNGVLVRSDTSAASADFVGCEMSGFLNDGISSKGSGGDAANRVVTAHFCYFHDIGFNTAPQAMTPHDNSTMKAFFCRFDNIGAADGSGNAIGSGTGTNPVEVYNCVITNCNSGVGNTGSLIVRNCVFNNILRDAVSQSGNAFDVTVADCTFAGISRSAISANGGGKVNIISNRIDARGAADGFPPINTLETTHMASQNRMQSLTVEDCLIYSPSRSNMILATKHRELILRRNLIWSDANNTLYGAVHMFYSVSPQATLLAEYNSIYKASGPIFSTWGVFPESGSYIIQSSYSGGFNTYQNGCQFGYDIMGRGWKPLATDKSAAIVWRDLGGNFMLPGDSPHYRGYGAAMMPGWIIMPPSSLPGSRAERYAVSGFTSCAAGYHLASDINRDCVTNMQDFAMLISEWLMSPEP